MKENRGQAAAELILIFGGIIVIVIVGLIFYKNYVSDLSEDIQKNELNDFNSQLDSISQYFK